MTLDPRRLYDALTAHDARFDGVFFVGVTSTGIYCRPICRVKTPKAANCRFFEVPEPKGWLDFGMTTTIEPDSDGYVQAPDGPGLGITIDWDVIDNATVLLT